MCFELLFGGAEHWLFICVNCIIFLTCWNFVSLSIPIVTCGLRLQLLTAMGRANMDVIWNDLVLQSKPLLACCGTGHHTLWACNLSLVNLTQDMPTHLKPTECLPFQNLFLTLRSESRGRTAVICACAIVSRIYYNVWVSGWTGHGNLPFIITACGTWLCDRYEKATGILHVHTS